MVEEEKKELSVMDEAKKVRDELKSENDRREKILVEETKLKSEQILAGTSGAIVQTVKAVESAKEYAERVLSGKKK